MENLNTIPTAEEFLKQVSPNDEFGLRIDLGNSKKHIYEIMCRFAKLHVEQALKEASEHANLYLHNPGWKHSSDIKTVKCHNYNASINKDSILNSYPLTLIK